MRISRKSFAVSEQKGRQIETPSWKVEYDQSSPVFKSDNGTTVVVEGDLYYHVTGTGKSVCFGSNDDICGLLKHVYDSVGEKDFPESVEGIYNVAVIDEEKDVILVFGDAFNRLNLFYCLDDRCRIISTEFRDVLSGFDTIDYDPAVFCCLMILGYPPLKHTPYSGLRRLAIGERLLLQNGKIHLMKADVRSLDSVEMDETNLNQYADILENSILSRSSQSENWVMVSAGWDSTIILGVLRKYFDAANVRPIILAMKLADGRYYNPYEIDKAMEIGKHYNVPVEVTTIDYGGVELPRIWEDASQSRRSDFVYTYLPTFQIIANVIQEKGKPDAAVFVGSFADGLHNFGFSQYISLPYLSYDFREYADKIRSYLYSPSFLKKVFNNTFEDDFAYKLFKWHHPKVEFVDVSSMSRNERIFEYLLSFVMSNSRLPFACIANDSIFSSEARVRFKEWLYENYFKDVVEQINCQNMYFWLIWLYQHFHLQGSEKGAMNASYRGYGKRPRWPYYDLRLVEFLQMMPENWGRGLEWRPIKYPLKHYGCERLRIPLEIVKSTFHSYISETDRDRSADLRREMINNSTMTYSTWRDMRDNPNSDKLFDKEWFNIAALNNMLQTGESESGSVLPLNLLALLSTGFEGEWDLIT